VELDLQRFYNVNRRILMWIAFFAILYVLRDFFAVVFLTFIFGFVMRTVARFLLGVTRLPYWLSVVVPYLAVLTLLVVLITMAIPRVADEAADFSKRVPDLFLKLAGETRTLAKRYNLESVLNEMVAGETMEEAMAPDRSEGKDAKPNAPAPSTAPDASGTGSAPGSTDGDALEASEGDSTLAASPPDKDEDEQTRRLAQRLQYWTLRALPGVFTQGRSTTVPDLLGEFVQEIAAGTLEFLLAVLLSFLIVLDYEGISRELQNWRKSPVGGFFQEATGSLVEFSGMVGWAFQCQLVVALLNAAITCIGMLILGIEPLLLLTTIVFVFGLIPVLGVFISSVPIILIAFNSGGLSLALTALGMIVVVHLLEAYVFNPRIYAARFHLNPVIVLIILLVAHELFGVWGMLLGIPVTHYVLNKAQMPSHARPKREGRRRRRRAPPSRPEEQTGTTEA
jgi:predicted PurR-regulated permease PerM